MLQQTQVTTVIPYFERFMTQFPNVNSLANATEDEVLHLWSGLGYYSRARNLHRSAKIIQHEWQGEFPADLETIQNLPGIGRSTAGAILTCAFNKKATILDGNVKRLLTRYHALSEAANSKVLQDKLWQLAEKYTPSKRVADYTQVMMDLGATLCTRTNPQCTACPLMTSCLAYKQNLTTQLPTPKTRRISPIRSATFLILQYKDKILLQKRPPIGIWGGLWSLPELAKIPSTRQIQAYCLKTFQLRPEKILPLDQFRHTFSHFHLDISPLHIQVENPTGKIMDSDIQIWYSLTRPKNIGLPAPILSLLGKLT